MQLPSNINSITTEVPASSLTPQKPAPLDSSKLLESISNSLPIDLKKYFDLGFNFYKLSNDDDIVFIKNLLLLCMTFYKTVLKDSSIEAEKQEAVNENLEVIFKNLENSLKIHDSMLNILKINKKVFDARKLFMIIIGYAISNVQKSS